MSITHYNLYGQQLNLGDECVHIYNGHGGIKYTTCIVVGFTPKRVKITTSRKFIDNDGNKSVHPRTLLPKPDNTPLWKSTGQPTLGDLHG